MPSTIAATLAVKVRDAYISASKCPEDYSCWIPGCSGPATHYQSALDAFFDGVRIVETGYAPSSSNLFDRRDATIVEYQDRSIGVHFDDGCGVPTARVLVREADKQIARQLLAAKYGDEPVAVAVAAGAPDEVVQALRQTNQLLQELASRYEVSIKPERPDEMPVINFPEAVFALLGPEMSQLAQEQLRILLLDTRNNVMGQRVIYQGNVNSSVVRPAEVFRPAIIEAATSIIVSHNHPSGDPTPSGADVSITRDLVEAGELLGIAVLDHVVIAGSRWVSMKEAKLGFE